MQTQKTWKSKIGFVLAASGAAIGLGNIQRFPYVLANYGGGAFLLVYLACVLLLGIPLVLCEFSLGRLFKENPYQVFKKSLPRGKFWSLVSLLPILIPFFIFTYYLVITSWTMGFTVLSFFDYISSMEELTSNAVLSPSLSLLGLLALCFVASFGLNKGVELLSSFMMPALFVLLIILLINSLCLEKSFEGLSFFFQADWSKVDAKLFIFAAGQAFFSLCIGEGVLLTYGSYVSKEDSLVSSALCMVIFDTLVAVVSGLIIFPALFTYGFSPQEDSTMIFKVMPEIFSHMAFGKILSLCFFLTLCFAAITTCLALMEVVINFFSETFSFSRFRATLVLFCLSLPFCLLASLSKGVVPFLSNMEIKHLGLKSFFDIIDFIYGNLGMILCGLLVSLIAGWRNLDGIKKELSKGSTISSSMLSLWGFLIAYLAPLAIFCILLLNFF